MSDTLDKRSSLPERWQKRFAILDRIEGKYWSRYKELTASERFDMFRIFGFLLGPIYYFILGMWHKGLILLVLTVLLTHLLVATDSESSLKYLGVALSAFCATVSTWDYYLKIECDEKVWSFLRKGIPEAVTSIPALLILVVGVTAFYIYDTMDDLDILDDPQVFTRACNDEGITDVVKELVHEHYFPDTASDHDSYTMFNVNERSHDPALNVTECVAMLRRPPSEVSVVTYSISPHQEVDGQLYVEILKVR